MSHWCNSIETNKHSPLSMYRPQSRSTESDWPGSKSQWYYLNATGWVTNLTDFILHHMSSSMTSNEIYSSWFSMSFALTSTAPRTIDSTSMNADAETCHARTLENRNVSSSATCSCCRMRSSIGMIKAIWCVVFWTKTPKTYSNWAKKCSPSPAATRTSGKVLWALVLPKIAWGTQGLWG